MKHVEELGRTAVPEMNEKNTSIKFTSGISGETSESKKISLSSRRNCEAI